MRNISWVALATFALLAGSAHAQIVIDFTGKGPVIIERDQSQAGHGGNGIVVHVGRLEVHTSDDVLNFSDFEKPSADLRNFNSTQREGGLSITLSLQRRPSDARTEAERIAELTGLLQALNDAVSRQCEPVVAVLGKPCRLSESSLHAFFQPSFNQRSQSGASANARFEIAPLGAASRNRNRRRTQGFAGNAVRASSKPKRKTYAPRWLMRPTVNGGWSRRRDEAALRPESQSRRGSLSHPKARPKSSTRSSTSSSPTDSRSSPGPMPSAARCSGLSR